MNFLLEMLRDSGVRIDVSPIAPLGKRLAEFNEAVARLTCAGTAQVVELLEEAQELIEQRNSLVHASVLAKGRVIPNDPKKAEFHVSPEALADLAERILHWKERLDVAVQRTLLPALRASATNGT